jgi:MFS family permease
MSRFRLFLRFSPFSLVLFCLFLHSASLALVLAALTDLVSDILFAGDVPAAAQFLASLESLLNLLQFFSNPLFGAASDSLGRKPFLVMSLAAVTVEFLLIAYYPSILILFLATILRGVTGITYTVAAIMTVDCSPLSGISSNLGLTGAAAGLGFMVGSIGGIFIAKFFANQLTIPFFLGAAVEFINVFVMQIGLPDSLNYENTRNSESKNGNLQSNNSLSSTSRHSSSHSSFSLSKSSTFSRVCSTLAVPNKHLGFFSNSGHFALPASPPLLSSLSSKYSQSPAFHSNSSLPPSNLSSLAHSLQNQRSDQTQANSSFDLQSQSLYHSSVSTSLSSSSIPSSPSPRSSRPFTLSSFPSFLRDHHPFSAISILYSTSSLLFLTCSFWLLNCGKAISKILFLYTKYEFHWNRFDNGLFMAFSGAVIILNQGFLLKKYLYFLSESQAIMWGIFVHVLSMIAFTVNHQSMHTYTIMFLSGFSVIAIPVLRGLISSEVPVDQRGKLQGALSSVITSSNFIGSLAFGQLFAYFTRHHPAVQNQDTITDSTVSNASTGAVTAFGFHWSTAPFCLSAVLHLLALPFLLSGMRKIKLKSVKSDVELDSKSASDQEALSPSDAQTDCYDSPLSLYAQNCSSEEIRRLQYSPSTILNFLSSGQLSRQTSATSDGSDASESFSLNGNGDDKTQFNVTISSFHHRGEAAASDECDAVESSRLLSRSKTGHEDEDSDTL